MSILLVTYNQMNGIPIGRHQVGNMIAYSGDYGRAKYMSLFGGPIGDQQKTDAEQTVGALRSDIEVDIPNVEEAYVYVGSAAMDGSMKLIQSLQETGKRIHMIACNCGRDQKVAFARQLNITEVMWCECGGRYTCAELVRKFSAPS